MTFKVILTNESGDDRTNKRLASIIGQILFNPIFNKYVITLEES